MKELPITAAQTNTNKIKISHQRISHKSLPLTLILRAIRRKIMIRITARLAHTMAPIAYGDTDIPVQITKGNTNHGM